MTTQIDLLKRHGIAVRGHLGQHLLIDPNIQRKIVDLLDIQTDEFVFEIGPGLGALTKQILERGAKVWAVEKDETFIRVLKEEFAAYGDRFRIFQGDILKFDLGKELPVRKPGFKMKVISNLPYYITAQILFYLLDYRAVISRAVLTMQKEVAQRFIASPGTKDYGRLTLAIRYAGNVEHAFDIPPSCFTPQPLVSSSVLTLTFNPPASRFETEKENFLFDLIRTAFSQRRKTLLRLLIDEPSIGLDRERVGKIFKEMGLAPTIRGEQLLLKDFITLAEHLTLASGKKNDSK